MRTTGLITAMIVALLPIQAIGTMEGARDTITVGGSGKAQAKPDVAYITLYARGGGILMTDAAQKAKQVAGEIENAVMAKHKEIKEVALSDVKIGERQVEYWGPDQKDESPNPEVIKQLRITLPPDPELAYSVIDTAIRAGATMQIPSSEFYSGEANSVVIYGLVAASEMENQARRRALENAKEDAEITVALIGSKVGDVVSIGCAGSSYWPQEFPMMGQEARFPTKYIGLDPEKIEISRTMSVTYSLIKE